MLGQGKTYERNGMQSEYCYVLITLCVLSSQASSRKSPIRLSASTYSAPHTRIILRNLLQT